MSNIIHWSLPMHYGAQNPKSQNLHWLSTPGKHYQLQNCNIWEILFAITMTEGNWISITGLSRSLSTIPQWMLIIVLHNAIRLAHNREELTTTVWQANANQVQGRWKKHDICIEAKLWKHSLNVDLQINPIRSHRLTHIHPPTRSPSFMITATRVIYYFWNPCYFWSFMQHDSGTILE